MLSSEMRLLASKWNAGASWPKWLEWLQIEGIRGWKGERVDFRFPLTVIVGENGSGKSTILQAAAAGYQSPTSDRFASDFFPDTPFEKIEGAILRLSCRQGSSSTTTSVRKPTTRWRGNPSRLQRPVEYIDLSRIQPIGARHGFAGLLKSGNSEKSRATFDEMRLKRLSNILGKQFTDAAMAETVAGPNKHVPILSTSETPYSGFHQGGGEITAAELIASDYPKYSLVLIDEIETSLHPRSQRRLIRDLAKVARERELQVIVTSHSPYVLDEVPPDARIYIMTSSEGKRIVRGVSPGFAMTQMDDEDHPDCDVYVEDSRAETLVGEVLVRFDRDLRDRCKIIPFGSASVGKALGQMVEGDRFPRPSVVLLDGDQDVGNGWSLLPGGDAPERVVFLRLQKLQWEGLDVRLGRGTAETIDAFNAVVANPKHHEWAHDVGNRLRLGADIVWQGAVATYIANADEKQDSEWRDIVDVIATKLAPPTPP